MTRINKNINRTFVFSGIKAQILLRITEGSITLIDYGTNYIYHVNEN